MTVRRHAASVSEAPLLQPLNPLGSFISQLGPVPDKEALAVYLRRMREHGWDVSSTIRKALQCGASIMPEVCWRWSVDLWVAEAKQAPAA